MNGALRKLAVLAVMVATNVAWAQNNLQDWTSVKNIPANSDVWVKARGGNVSGHFMSADDHELRIEPHARRTIFSRGRGERTISRGAVREIRFARRAVSALAGTAIGAGLGAAAGLAIEAQYPNKTEDGHLAAAVFGLLGGLFGEVVGEHTAFIHGDRIYVAP